MYLGLKVKEGFSKGVSGKILLYEGIVISIGERR